jgi:hypothetical protein
MVISSRYITPKSVTLDVTSKKTKTDKRAVSSSEISFLEILYREHFN